VTCSKHANDEYGIPINVFTIEPARQQELVELLTRATERSVLKQALAIATFEPGMYEVVRSFAAAGTDA